MGYSAPLLRLFVELATKRQAEELAAERLSFLDLARLAIISSKHGQRAAFESYKEVRAELEQRVRGVQTSGQDERRKPQPARNQKSAIAAVMRAFKTLKR
jgi:hypothetical protein